MEIAEKYDVAILGGGLAGLTLALQLKQSKPELSIIVLEKRTDFAPTATHKVGESVSELGASYLREVLNLKAYLTEHQLPKYGFRFFFSPEHRDNIDRRVEVGSRFQNPFPSHQVDRGLLENELVRQLLDLGVEIVLGAKTWDVAVSNAGHSIRFNKEDKEYLATGSWLVDATGRSSLLKRKLGLEKQLDHDINAAWFRFGTAIDIDDWSENLTWRNYVDPGLRRLATNHLMGEGYWVWIIPLVSNSTSIGIVADPKYHPFNEFNTFDKAMKWLERHEPLAARMLGKYTPELLDFKLMKHLSYDSMQFYSADRWAITGEAGAFLDPLYSPGTDFIALSNTWITDLIVRERQGEPIAKRAMVFDFAHKELLRGWMHLYKNMYGLFGKTQIMSLKIVWDWASYWALPCVLFMNEGYINMAILKQYAASADSIGERFAKLNERMQELFQIWGRHKQRPFADHHLNLFDLRCLHQFQAELGLQYQSEALMDKVAANLHILEQISAEIFRRVSTQIHGTPEDMMVDPYVMSLEDGKNELLRKAAGSNAIAVFEPIRTDIAKMWLGDIKRQEKECRSTVASNMEYIQKLFLRTQDFVQKNHALEAWIGMLDAEPLEFRSVAYESASMEIGFQALSEGKGLETWKKFYDHSKEVHSFHLEIGLGWAIAKAGISPALDLEALHLITQNMVFDGMGYYHGLFRGRGTVKNQLVPAGIDGQALPGFDQGLGRRLWYICKGDVDVLLRFLEPFPASRHPDLWRGIGIACGYVGGSTEANLKKLLACATDFKQQLRTGVALAAISRNASGSVNANIEMACQIICNMSLAEIIGVHTIEYYLWSDTDKIFNFPSDDSAAEFDIVQ